MSACVRMFVCVVVSPALVVKPFGLESLKNEKQCVFFKLQPTWLADIMKVHTDECNLECEAIALLYLRCEPHNGRPCA